MNRTDRRSSHRLVRGVANAFGIGLRRRLGLGLLKLALTIARMADRLVSDGDNPQSTALSSGRHPTHLRTLQAWLQARKAGLQAMDTVSYTHLTLPTICSV